MAARRPIWEDLFLHVSSSLSLSHMFNLVSRKMITPAPPPPYFIGRGHEVNSLITIINPTSVEEVWERTLPTLGKQLG